MTWKDSRPQFIHNDAAAEAWSPPTHDWALHFDLWSTPKPPRGGLWSRATWWWGSEDKDDLKLDAQHISASGETLRWDELWMVRLEAWLLSNTYLELTISLMSKPQGAVAGKEVMFKIVAPHRLVASSVDVKQNWGLPYLNPEDAAQVWPVIEHFGRLQGLEMDKVIIGAPDALPDWDVVMKAESDAALSFLERRRIDRWFAELDPYADTVNLQTLHDLSAEGLRVVFERLSTHPRMKTLEVRDCDKLHDLNSLAPLNRLEALSIFGCAQLQALSLPTGLIRLKKLKVGRCEALKTADLSACHQLATLELSDCPELELDGLGTLDTLTRLTLSRLPAMTSMDFARPLKALEDLRANHITNVDVDALTELTRLKRLALHGHNLHNMDALRHCTQLETLTLSGCPELKSVAGLSGCERLSHVTIRGATQLKKLDGLQNKRLLTHLNLEGCGLNFIDELEGCAALLEIDLTNNAQLLHLDGLKGCGRLRQVTAEGCHSLTNVDGLAHAKTLTTLQLNHCRSLAHLEGLRDHAALETLSLRDCISLRDLFGLKGCLNLKTLDLTGCNVRRHGLSLNTLFEGEELQALLRRL